jgi:hypothetical protein
MRVHLAAWKHAGELCLSWCYERKRFHAPQYNLYLQMVRL